MEIMGSWSVCNKCGTCGEGGSLNDHVCKPEDIEKEEQRKIDKKPSSGELKVFKEALEIIRNDPEPLHPKVTFKCGKKEIKGTMGSRFIDEKKLIEVLAKEYEVKQEQIKKLSLNGEPISFSRGSIQMYNGDMFEFSVDGPVNVYVRHAALWKNHEIVLESRKIKICDLVKKAREIPAFRNAVINSIARINDIVHKATSEKEIEVTYGDVFFIDNLE